MKQQIRPLLLVLACSAAMHAMAADKLELRKNDHICIIGNTLADRMQHSGWIESLIYTKFPKHDLVFRNLGFSGDELTVRMRSEAFGSPDEWLKHEQADVIFAMFGFNESFQDQAGLDKFRTDLDKFIKDTLKQDYSGKGAPRLVLFSPIAQEKHPDPNFPTRRKTTRTSNCTQTQWPRCRGSTACSSWICLPHRNRLTRVRNSP